MNPEANTVQPRAAASGSRAAPLRWPPVTCIAPTRFGPLVLTLQGQAAHAPPAVDTVCAALLVAQAEPLLQMLEDWLGEPLDPEPGTPAESAVWAAQAEALLGSADGQAQLHACVQLPWAALQACHPEDAALRERLQALQWKALPAQLMLSRQALTADEWTTLAQAGAALLLPESMAQPAWCCLLRAPQHHEVPPLQVQWEPVQGGLHWPAAGALPAPLPQDAVAVEAVLETTVHLTPPQWLAWDGPQALACSGQRAALVRVDAPGTALAGELLPLALGAGGAGGVLLRVDALPGSAGAQG